jgi:hypothetical protein
MYKFMNVGLIHFMAYPQVMRGEGPILETLQKIAEDDFFTAVEVSWIKDVKVRQKAKKLLEVSHLTVAYGAQPRLEEYRDTGDECKRGPYTDDTFYTSQIIHSRSNGNAKR